MSTPRLRSNIDRHTRQRPAVRRGIRRSPIGPSSGPALIGPANRGKVRVCSCVGLCRARSRAASGAIGVRSCATAYRRRYPTGAYSGPALSRPAIRRSNRARSCSTMTPDIHARRPAAACPASPAIVPGVSMPRPPATSSVPLIGIGDYLSEYRHGIKRQVGG